MNTYLHLSTLIYNVGEEQVENEQIMIKKRSGKSQNIRSLGMQRRVKINLNINSRHCLDFQCSLPKIKRTFRFIDVLRNLRDAKLQNKTSLAHLHMKKYAAEIKRIKNGCFRTLK